MKFLCDITTLQLMKYIFPLGIKCPLEINESLLPKLLLNFVSSLGTKYLYSCQNRDLSSLASLQETVEGEEANQSEQRVPHLSSHSSE